MKNSSTLFHSKIMGIIFLILLFLPFYIKAQPKNDWMRTVDYIPMHTGLASWWFEDPNRHYILNIIKNAGIDIINANVNDLDWMDTIANAGLRAIVARVHDPNGPNLLNNVQYYTDAKYSEWEAEGTPLGKGDATLYHDTARTHIIPETGGNPGYVIIDTAALNSTFEIINGPYYTSEVRYYVYPEKDILSKRDTIVYYTANFRLMLQDNPNNIDTVRDTSTAICRIRVTYSNHNGLYELGSTYSPRDTILTLGAFKTLNQFQDHELEEYDLTTNPPPPPPYVLGYENTNIFSAVPGIEPYPKL